MSGNPIDWFEIYVQDMDRARRFYEAVLGVELNDLSGPGELEMLGFPADGNAPGSGGALVCAMGVASGNNSTLVYFRCSDCAEPAARVEDSGGTLLRGKMSIGPHGFVALAEDTEGNRFGLHSAR